MPERTKGYFTSHTAAVSKVLHGYHVQITARSDSDLEPASIIQKVSDASGAKYTAGGSAPMPGPAPPVAKKPVFTPTASSAGRSFNPLVAARNRKDENVDEDGWGQDAPPVTRTQLEKVQPAYKPTKVNISDLTKNQDPSSNNGSSDAPGVVRGAYQPVGKVDIAAIRAAAKNQDDLRPAPVKGSYEPVGKVDIAAIRARSQKPAEPTEEEEAPRPSLAERTAAFSQSGQSERLTSLPKPKVANKFGGAASFTGTKAPTPGGLGLAHGAPAVPGAAPVGAASRTFADQGGKTPAQIWAEKKARERGASGSGSGLPPPATSPVTAQKSGSGWKSGYSGKSWGAVETGAYGRGIAGQKTGDDEQSAREEPTSPSGGVSSLKDRFKGAAPMGASAPSIPREATGASDAGAPPPPPEASRPSGGFALPGLPSRPAADNQEDEEEQPEPEHSPIRVAAPVPRIPEPELEPAPQQLPARPVPVPEELPREEEMPEEEEAYDPRGAATAVAEETFSHEKVHDAQGASSGGERAVVEYDYEKGEDNEIELKEGEYVTNIEKVDEDWWMGTNAQGESGLFPSNYVTIVEDDGPGAGTAAAPPPPHVAEPEPEHTPAAGGGPTATALFDYEAAEDNGKTLSYSS